VIFCDVLHDSCDFSFLFDLCDFMWHLLILYVRLLTLSVKYPSFYTLIFTEAFSNG